MMLTQRIPVKALIDAADPELNLKLTGGEEIRVPEVGKFFVLGNVKKPGVFAAQGGAEVTVLKALAMAEGLLPYAAKRAYIYRQEASGTKNEIPIELRQMMDRKTPMFRCLPTTSCTSRMPRGPARPWWPWKSCFCSAPAPPAR